MSDQVSFNPDQVAAQPSGEPIQQGGAGQEPKYVTLADMEAFEQRLERRLQSLTDKQESRLKKEFEKQLSERQQAYATLGLSMPEEEKTAIARRVMDSVSPDGKQPGQAAPSPEQPVDPITAAGMKIMSKAGVTWGDIPPEEARTIRTNGDPDEYLEDIKRLAQAAAARKQNQQAKPNNPAAAPALGEGQPAGGDLMQQYLREVQQARPGEERIAIRAKYRAKGLPL